MYICRKEDTVNTFIEFQKQLYAALPSSFTAHTISGTKSSCEGNNRSVVVDFHDRSISVEIWSGKYSILHNRARHYIPQLLKRFSFPIANDGIFEEIQTILIQLSESEKMIFPDRSDLMALR